MTKLIISIHVLRKSLLIFILCALSGLWLLNVQNVYAGQGTNSINNLTYIDTHNHLFGRFSPRSGSQTDYNGAAEVALNSMNNLGIKKMIIMPPPLSLKHPIKYDVDDFLHIAAKYPDRFAFMGGGGTLNVMIQKSVYDRTSPNKRFKRKFQKKALEILSKGAIGFGEFTAEHFSLGQNHPYESAPPNHPLFLLLADIAAHHNVPIDIHMEAVLNDISFPKHIKSNRNPRELQANIAGFEELLSHNRKAKIIWAHVGWDNTGHRTPQLIVRLFNKHPNLFMSFKISPKDSLAKTCPIEKGIGLKNEWLNLIRDFPDRFIIGSDQFYLSPKARRRRIGPPSVIPTHKFLSLLPSELAQKVGYENAMRLFNLN